MSKKQENIEDEVIKLTLVYKKELKIKRSEVEKTVAEAKKKSSLMKHFTVEKIIEV